MNRDDSGNTARFSAKRQWQEKSSNNFIHRSMNYNDMQFHRLNLVRLYECDDNDITFDFEKIKDNYDEDRDDCMWLHYFIKCIPKKKGDPNKRLIFTLKIDIPDHIRKARAEHDQKNMAIQHNCPENDQSNQPITQLTPPTASPNPPARGIKPSGKPVAKMPRASVKRVIR